MKTPPAPASELQWGRTPVSAESLKYTVDEVTVCALQWGRTPVSAESCMAKLKMSKWTSASMGPHSGECGKGLEK